MKVRITNKGRSPRGIHDSSGHRIVTIAPKETREMDLSEAQIMRYRAKIAGGDTLELVEPLGAGAAEYKPVPEKAAKAEKPAKEPKAAKTKAEKPKAEKAPAETAPATDSKEALQAEAAKLGIPGYQNFGTKRLRREIAAKKAELAEAGDSE